MRYFLFVPAFQEVCVLLSPILHVQCNSISFFIALLSSIDSLSMGKKRIAHAMKIHQHGERLIQRLYFRTERW
jgi:hypothetical protein